VAQTVLVAGLGAMGMGVARSLLRAGFRVEGFDLDAAKTAALVADGGVALAVPDAPGDPSGCVVLLVATAAQAADVLFGRGLAAALDPGACVLLCATVPPAFAVDTARRLGERGVLMLEAPVSGGPVRAAEAKMTVMASGAEAAFARSEAVLAAIAARVYRLGAAYGTASVVKAVNQHLAGIHIAAAAEAMALGIRAGADPRTLYDVISASAGNSWMFENRVPHILAGDYTPLSAVDIFVKDLGIVTDLARSHTFPTPLAATALQLFTMAAAAGYGRQDDSAVIKVYERLAGIALPGAAEGEE
jgi:3-hydroxyisobutyrate dehydrogenase